jgi:hypothetical protein
MRVTHSVCAHTYVHTYYMRIAANIYAYMHNACSQPRNWVLLILKYKKSTMVTEILHKPVQTSQQQSDYITA